MSHDISTLDSCIITMHDSLISNNYASNPTGSDVVSERLSTHALTCITIIIILRHFCFVKFTFYAEDGGGGGIYVRGNMTLEMTSCIVSDNISLVSHCQYVEPSLTHSSYTLHSHILIYW